MKYCPKCNKKYPSASAQFCNTCGTALVDENLSTGNEVSKNAICPSCRRQVQADQEYCSFCGKRLNPDDKDPEGSNRKDSNRKITLIVIIVAVVAVVAAVGVRVFTTYFRNNSSQQNNTEVTQSFQSDGEQNNSAPVDENQNSEGFLSLRTRLTDDAHLLSEEEANAILSNLDSVSEELQLDIVIVTTSTLSGKTPMAYADDFYDNNEFGYGDGNDGVLLLVSMENRDWHITTTGVAIEIINDSNLQKIEDSFLPDLSKGNYYSSFLSFINATKTIVKKEAHTNTSQKEHSSPVIANATTLNGVELGSSNVSSERSFEAYRAIDKDVDTCWCVNTKETGGAGAKIRITLKSKAPISGFRLVNGNQFRPYDDIYSANGQIKDFTLEFSNGKTLSFTADYNDGDPNNYQDIALSEPIETEYIILTVNSAYVGDPYNTNVCLTEFDVY